MKPPFRWLGDKLRLRSKLKQLIPTDFNRYFEPMVGGGPFFFELERLGGWISDKQGMLIECYKELAYRVDRVLVSLNTHEERLRDFVDDSAVRYSEDAIQEIKSKQLGEVTTWQEYYLYQSVIKDIERWTPASRAARLILLTQMADRHEWKANSYGYMCADYNRSFKIPFYDSRDLVSASRVLQDTQIECCDFEEAFGHMDKEDLVYCDPPDDGVIDTYGLHGFDVKDHQRLGKCLADAHDKGVHIIATVRGRHNLDHYPQSLSVLKLKNIQRVSMNGDSAEKALFCLTNLKRQNE